MNTEESNKGYLLGAAIGILVVGVLHALGRISVDSAFDSAIYYGGLGGCGGMVIYELFRRLFSGIKSSKK